MQSTIPSSLDITLSTIFLTSNQCIDKERKDTQRFQELITWLDFSLESVHTTTHAMTCNRLREKNTQDLGGKMHSSSLYWT